jgi:RNA polymerase sigma-70 factor, ECF subfamily
MFVIEAPEQASAPLVSMRSSHVAATERVAFEALFHEHSDGLTGFLYRRLRNREDAEDALMETFFKAWRARSTFRGETGQKQWLYGIAGRVAIDAMRRGTRRAAEIPTDLEQTEIADTYGDRVQDPSCLLMESERRAEIREAMHRLKPEQRELLQLHYFDGYQYDEISSALGIPYTKVRGRLHRIRQLIQRDLVHRYGHSQA